MLEKSSFEELYIVILTIIFLPLIVLLLLFLFLKRRKKIKKVNKEERRKYTDMLTSLLIISLFSSCVLIRMLAAVGYSMITDEIKTIDDAINEATLEMRRDKEEYK